MATKAEPEAGDVTVTEDTVTETADAGPLAKASGGSSLFDTPAPEKAEASSGGSLFDTPAPAKAEEKAEEKAEPATGRGRARGDRARRQAVRWRVAVRHPGR